MALCPVRITERGRERLGVSLAVLNCFVALLGLMIVGMGVYVRVYVEQYTDLLQDYNVKPFVHLLVSVGLLTALVHLVGAKMCYDCGYWRTRERFQSVLLIYIILVFLLFFLLVSSAIVAFCHKHSLAQAFESGFSTTMTKYRDDPAAKERFDRLQMSYRCCGSKGYKEWFDLSWISNTYLNTTNKAVAAQMKDGDFITDSVPFSCCNPKSERPCVHHDVTKSHKHVKYNPESPTLFDRGCVEPLMEFMQTRVILPSALLAFITSFSQIVVFIVARYLQTSIHNAYKWNRPRGRSLGFILEQMPCSCMEELHTAPGPDDDEEYGGNQDTDPLIEKKAPRSSKKSDSTLASSYRSASSSRSGSTGYSADSAGSHRSRRNRGLEQRLNHYDERDRRLSKIGQPQSYNPPPMEDQNEKGFEDLLAAAAEYDGGGGQQQDGGGEADGGHEGNQGNKDQQGRDNKKDTKSEKKKQKEQKKAEKKKEKEKKKQEKADKKKQKKAEKSKNKKDKKRKNKTDKKGKGKKDKKGAKGKSKKKTIGGKKLKKSGKAKKPKPKKIKRKKPKMKKPKMKRPKMKKMKAPKMRKMKAPKMRKAGGGRKMGRRR